LNALYLYSNYKCGYIFRLDNADTTQSSIDNEIAPELDEREKLSIISMPNGVTLRRVSDIRN
jgi:hypothetical protein